MNPLTIRFTRLKIRTIIDMIAVTMLVVYFLFVYIYNQSANVEYYWPMILLIVFSFDMLTSDDCLITLSASYVVYVYTIFTLFGFVALYPMFPEIENIRSQYTMSFLKYSELSKAVVIASVFVGLYSVFAVIFSHVNTQNLHTKVIGNGIKDLDCTSSEKYKSITYISIAILTICTLYFIYYALTHSDIFSMTYEARSVLTNNDSIFVHFTKIMGLAFVMAISTADRKQMLIVLGVFSVCAVFHFLIGNRGEVYYPVFAFIAVYVKRNGTIKRKTLIIGVLVSLLAISAIRAVRGRGNISGGVIDYFMNVSPVTAMAETLGEMGFQIATITYMLRYLGTGGMLMHGSTLLYSMQVFWCKYLPFIPQPDTNSPAAIKTIMPADYFAFTNVGEAYYNFAIVGVVLFAVFLAYFMVLTGKKHENIFVELFFNMLLIVNLSLVRNTTASLMVYLAWIIVLILIVRLFSRAK